MVRVHVEELRSRTGLHPLRLFFCPGLVSGIEEVRNRHTQKRRHHDQLTGSQGHLTRQSSSQVCRTEAESCSSLAATPTLSIQLGADIVGDQDIYVVAG